MASDEFPRIQYHGADLRAVAVQLRERGAYGPVALVPSPATALRSAIASFYSPRHDRTWPGVLVVDTARLPDSAYRQVDGQWCADLPPEAFLPVTRLDGFDTVDQAARLVEAIEEYWVPLIERQDRLDTGAQTRRTLINF